VEQETFGQIESIATTSRELLQTLDEIVWAVNPRNDSLEHLAAYLSHYAAEYFQNTDVQCELRLPRDLPHVPLSAELRHNLFLAFEEVLNNALKHSGATKVRIEMITGRGAFQINVTDNGRGFDVAAVREKRPMNAGRGGNGMLNIRQRLSAVDGECVVRSSPREICPASESVDAQSGDAVVRAMGKTSGDAASGGRSNESGAGTTVTLRIPLGSSRESRYE
jgi:signal transduction histidine kinase